MTLHWEKKFQKNQEEREKIEKTEKTKKKKKTINNYRTQFLCDYHRLLWDKIIPKWCTRKQWKTKNKMKEFAKYKKLEEEQMEKKTRKKRKKKSTITIIIHQSSKDQEKVHLLVSFSGYKKRNKTGKRKKIRERKNGNEMEKQIPVNCSQFQ